MNMQYEELVLKCAHKAFGHMMLGQIITEFGLGLIYAGLFRSWAVGIDIGLRMLVLKAKMGLCLF
jgi:hypothetical protein